MARAPCALGSVLGFLSASEMILATFLLWANVASISVSRALMGSKVPSRDGAIVSTQSAGLSVSWQKSRMWRLGLKRLSTVLDGAPRMLLGFTRRVWEEDGEGEGDWTKAWVVDCKSEVRDTMVMRRFLMEPIVSELLSYLVGEYNVFCDENRDKTMGNLATK